MLKMLDIASGIEIQNLTVIVILKVSVKTMITEKNTVSVITLTSQYIYHVSRALIQLLKVVLLQTFTHEDCLP